MRFAETRRHDPFDWEMRRNSTALRKVTDGFGIAWCCCCVWFRWIAHVVIGGKQLAAQLLERNDETQMYIQDGDTITIRELLQAASEVL
jgi:hypothetical protein